MPAGFEQVGVQAIVQGANQFVSDLNKMEAAERRAATGADTLASSANKGSGPLGALKGALGGVATIASGFVLGAGIVSMPSFLMNAAKAAAEDEASVLRLNQAIKNTGADIGVTTKKVNERIEAAQKLGFTDDQVRDSFIRLANATGDSDEALKRQTLAFDVARGTGLDLGTASRLLGRVTDENVQVFKRYGIALEEGASAEEAMAALQAKFSGQAEAYAKSTAGGFAQVSIRIDEAKERIGYALIPIMLQLSDVLIKYILPPLELLIEVAAKALEGLISGFEFLIGLGIEKFWDTFGEDISGAIEAVKQFGSDLYETMEGPVMDGLETVGNWLSDNWPKVLAGAFGPTGVLIYKFRDDIKTGLGEAVDWLRETALPAVSDFATKGFDFLGEHIEDVLEPIGDFATAVADLVDSGIDKVAQWLSDIASDIAGADWSGPKDFFVTVAALTWGAMQDAWVAVSDAVTGADWAAVGDFFKKLGDVAWGAIQDAWDAISDAFTAVDWGAVGEVFKDMAAVTWDAVQAAFETIGTALAGIDWNAVREGMAGITSREASGGVSGLGEAFVGLGDALGQITEILGPQLIETFDALWEAIKPVVRSLMEDLGPALKELGVALGPLAEIVGVVLVGAAYALLEAVKQLAPFIGETLVFAIRVAASIIEGFAGVVSGLVSVIEGAIDIIAGLFTGDWGRIWEGAKELFEGPIIAIEGILSGFASLVEAIFGLISGYISAAMEVIKDILSAAWGVIKGLIEGALGGIKDVVVTGFNAVVGFLDTSKDMLLDVVLWPYRQAWNLVSGIWSNIKTAVSEGFNAVWGFIETYGPNVLGALLWPFEQMRDKVGGIWDSIWTNVRSGAKKVLDLLATAVNAIPRAINWALDKLGIPGIPEWTVPQLARGTDNWPGGLAWVGEQGKELAYLPEGASVVPHGKSMEYARSMGMDIPGFQFGLGDLGDVVGDIAEGIGNGVGAIKDFIEEWANKPIELLVQAALDAAGFVGLPTFGGPFLNPLVKSFWDKASSGLFDLFKSWILSGVDALKKLISSPGNVPSGVTDWINQAMLLTGVSGADWANALALIAQYESGFNPNAQNLTPEGIANNVPSGIMQTIVPTFYAYALPGHTDIFNPVDNIAAAIRYIEARYGSPGNVPGVIAIANGQPYVGYAEGGLVSAGNTVIVGEHGPELFVPTTSGLIVPGVAKDTLANAGEQVSLQMVLGLGQGFADGAPAAMKAMNQFVGLLGQEFLDTLATWAPEAQKAMAVYLFEVVAAGGDALNDYLQDLPEDVRPQARAFGEALAAEVGNSFATGYATVQESAALSLQSWSNIFIAPGAADLANDQIKQLFTDISAFIENTPLRPAIVKWAEEALGALNESFVKGKGVADAAVSDLIDGLLAEIGGVGPEIDKRFVGISDGISIRIADVGSVFVGQTQKMMEAWLATLQKNLDEGIEMGPTEIDRMFIAMIETVDQAGFPDAVQFAVHNAIQAMAQAFKDGKGVANASVIDLINTILGTLKEGGKDIAAAAKTIIDTSLPPVLTSSQELGKTAIYETATGSTLPVGFKADFPVFPDQPNGPKQTLYWNGRNWQQQPVYPGSEMFAKPKRMARGGIITHPLLAMLGEHGPEMVIPLSQRMAPPSSRSWLSDLFRRLPTTITIDMRYAQLTGSLEENESMMRAVVEDTLSEKFDRETFLYAH